MTPKVLIVGMCNPQGNPPLWPDVPGTAGWRLWQISGMEKERWMAAFDRINILSHHVRWDFQLAREAGGELWSDVFPGREALILGREAARALWLPGGTPWVLPQQTDALRWRLLPHPSGRNQVYNDPRWRGVVKLLLEELADD